MLVAGVTAFVVADSDSSSSSARPSPGGPTCAVHVDAAAAADDAPVFRAPGLDRGCIDLADYRGRPVLLNFWASYCTPCREEFPLLKEANAKYRDDGLAIIGISHRDIDDDARAFADDQAADWLLGFDDTGDIAKAYGVRPIPQTFFITRDGKISSRLFQSFTTMQELDQQLQPILRRDDADAAADG
jgi:cytochrome c biogenesis protein CcmG/thiol:disulfide interchange protein DsbE